MPTSPSRLPTSLVDDVSRASPTGQSAQSTPTSDRWYRSDDLKCLGHNENEHGGKVIHRTKNKGPCGLHIID